MTKPKVLLFDIETMAKKAYVWGNYEQNIIATAEDWYMLSFAYKWDGESTTHVHALPDYTIYKSDPTNDKDLTQELWNLFNQADVVIAHNGRKFDVKKANARFIKHSLLPPKPYKIVDTREVAKRYFRFDSNILDDLGEYFGIGRKINTGGFELWLECEKGDKDAWAKMRRYNKQDIILLEKVYKRMLPYMDNHPNIGLLLGNKHACPNCGSSHIVKQGKRRTRSTEMQQYQCIDCGAWSSSPAPNSQVR
jgi:uncharacterized protein YprB with RNaseH-like and TPR domain